MWSDRLPFIGELAGIVNLIPGLSVRDVKEVFFVQLVETSVCAVHRTGLSQTVESDGAGRSSRSTRGLIREVEPAIGQLKVHN